MENKFNSIICDIFKLKPADVRDDLTPKDIPDWDSMNYLLFISEVEKQFDVSFSMDDVLNAKSLGSIKEAMRLKEIKI